MLLLFKKITIRWLKKERNKRNDNGFSSVFWQAALSNTVSNVTGLIPPIIKFEVQPSKTSTVNYFLPSNFRTMDEYQSP